MANTSGTVRTLFSQFILKDDLIHLILDSSKSVEGTLASIIGQSAFVYTLFALGYIPMTMKLAAICEVAILSNALIEARTNQVDNLVLPLVSYIILTFK